MAITNLYQWLPKGSGVLLHITPQFQSQPHIHSEELIGITALAAGLHYQTAQWVVDGGQQISQLLWISCTGADWNVYKQHMLALVSHFSIEAYAFVEVNDEDVCVRLQTPHLQRTWWSAGFFITDEWESRFLTEFLGDKAKLIQIRAAKEHEMIQLPQTNFARLAKQLTFKRLLIELNLDGEMV